MQWILVIMISMCWCEVDAIKCLFETGGCHNDMKADWFNNLIHVPCELNFLDKLVFDLLVKEQEQLPVYPPGVRQECRTLSDEARNLLFRAFQWLFSTRPNWLSLFTRYRFFMCQHRKSESPGAHFGPCFPPWHREFLWRFEQALKRYNSSVNLCYWDSSLDYPLPDASHSCLWTAEFFGNGQGPVTTGFAANRDAYPEDCVVNGLKLTRQVGGNDYLYTKDRINEILNLGYSFTTLMTPFDTNTFEMYHGGPHVFVGGHMSSIPCAALDPTFWCHHTFIDLLWERCRQRQTTDKETDYPDEPEIPPDHKANATMKPFTGKVCKDGLSNSYIPGRYSYLPSPDACTTKADCGGKTLFCLKGQCTACVGENGQMGADWPDNGCYITNCPTPRKVNNTCTCAP